ncbi:hypothetical protein ZIOFF_011314 [Zingiber officinale]|uniref:Uncharacterized protein n=1 Tax=Zingiber officinale TaxID=94328 RepID=A0A8J5I7T4_ZINOF|nr:hypothetical protein ZIOFF_011314 [Zingiber officinale]
MAGSGGHQGGDEASSYLHIDHHAQLLPRVALDLLGAAGRDDGHARRQAHGPAGVAAGLPRRLHHGHRAAIRPRDRAPRTSRDEEQDRHHAPAEDRVRAGGVPIPVPGLGGLVHADWAAGVLLQRGVGDDAVAGDVTIMGVTLALGYYLSSVLVSMGRATPCRRDVGGEGEGEVDGGTGGAVEGEVQEDREGEVDGGAGGVVEGEAQEGGAGGGAPAAWGEALHLIDSRCCASELSMESKKSNKITDIVRLRQMIKKWKKLAVGSTSKMNASAAPTAGVPGGERGGGAASVRDPDRVPGARGVRVTAEGGGGGVWVWPGRRAADPVRGGPVPGHPEGGGEEQGLPMPCMVLLSGGRDTWWRSPAAAQACVQMISGLVPLLPWRGMIIDDDLPPESGFSSD